MTEKRGEDKRGEERRGDRLVMEEQAVSVLKGGGLRSYSTTHWLSRELQRGEGREETEGGGREVEADFDPDRALQPLCLHGLSMMGSMDDKDTPK